MIEEYYKYHAEIEELYHTLPTWGSNIPNENERIYRAANTEYSQAIYYVNKKLEFHREDGPAIISNNGITYFIDGLAHRENGPANIFSDGAWNYKRRGITHRLDGPAVKYIAQKKRIIYEWYVDGLNHSVEMDEFCRENDIDVENISEDERTLLKFKLASFL